MFIKYNKIQIDQFKCLIIIIYNYILWYNITIYIGTIKIIRIHNTTPIILT